MVQRSKPRGTDEHNRRSGKPLALSRQEHARRRIDEAFAGYPGVYGDRVFAFKSSASPPGFPYFTAREQRRLLQYRPRFRYPDKAAGPVNLTDADKLGAGSLSADISELMVDVENPDGKTVAIDDPVLIEMLRGGIYGKHQLTLMRSHRAMTDCRPVSIFSLQSARQLSKETETDVDKRRFRARYLDLASDQGFGENELVGRSVKIGPRWSSEFWNGIRVAR